ncbi:MAG: hypothetical protein ACRELT_15940 [Longimicrobiales bacterium]
MPVSLLNPTSPRFAHGLALAAFVPYAAMLLVYADAFRKAEAEELAMLKFVAMFVVIAGYPLMLLLCMAVFGAAFLIHRSRRSDVWPYVLWGAGGAAAFLFVLWFGGPRSSLADDIFGVVVAIVIGGVSGAAFWAGAIPRSRATTQ